MTRSAILLLLVGCAGEEPLLAGSWSPVSLDFHDDECGTLSDNIGPEDWTLTWIDAHTFDNGSDTYVVHRDEARCQTCVREDAYPLSDGTATFVITRVGAGIIESPTVFLEEMTLDASCAGGTCASLGDVFPCTLGVSTEAHWMGE